jgi:lipoprotein-anchoring transpeptidase ErfK/SrfK
VNKILTIIGVGIIVLVLMGVMVFGAKNSKIFSAAGSQGTEGLIKEGKLEEAKAKLDEIVANKPNQKGLDKAYYELANAYEAKNDVVIARDIYQAILKKYSDIENIQEVQDKLDKLNVAILFSKSMTDKDILYEIEPGDNLTNIAKKFGTTVELIKMSNGLKSDNIQARTKIKVSKSKYKILVDKSQNSLTLLRDGEVFKVYRVSTGENNCTPVGNFQIVSRIVDPVWYTQGAIVPAESPDNILGSRWLGLSVKGYGIHGTTMPESIGTQATKGCVRMLNLEVEELYVIVPVGTDVTIVD